MDTTISVSLWDNQCKRLLCPPSLVLERPCPSSPTPKKEVQKCYPQPFRLWFMLWTGISHLLLRLKDIPYHSRKFSCWRKLSIHLCKGFDTKAKAVSIESCSRLVQWSLCWRWSWSPSKQLWTSLPIGFLAIVSGCWVWQPQQRSCQGHGCQIYFHQD